jgi:ribosomal protein L3
MALGLIGKKIGMTQKFYESGEAVPVTVLQVEPGKIVDVISKGKEVTRHFLLVTDILKAPNFQKQ